jgi:dienelactone hydrolase
VTVADRRETPQKAKESKPHMSNPTWSLRSLLSPVVARLLILGVNPMDLEGVFSRLEGKPILNAKMLENRWLAEWATLSDTWKTRAREALAAGHVRTAHTCLFHASTCGLARFLINTADLESKKAVYLDYAATYRETMDHAPAPVQDIAVECPGNFRLAALLHLPAGQGPHPVAVVFAGLGSCKEEMHTIARALVDRGIAALVPDMPGCGASLFNHGVPCSMERVEQAITGLANAVQVHPALDASNLGATGLCMGGGYAFRATALDTRYRYGATLFPLFISMTDMAGVPQWMRSGPWIEMQTGTTDSDRFVASMGPASTDAPKVPFFVVHGRHDNWMTWESATALLARVDNSRRDLLTIESEPVITGGNATTHAMPVGEQMHWTVPLVADWMADRVAELRG